MDDPVQQLIRRLGSKDEAARRAAEEELLALGPRAADTIVEMLRRAARRRKRARLATGSAVIGVDAVGMAALYVIPAARSSAGHGPNYVWTAITGAMYVFALLNSVVGMLLAATSRETNAARLLARMDDPRLAGPLAEALDIASEVRTALPRLLLRLAPEDARRLDERQRAILRRHLKNVAGRGELDQAEADMAEGIVRALTAGGDTEALPAVRRLADGSYRDRGARARQAARECVPVLERMQATQQAGRTLLRASVGGDATELLRPASGSGADGGSDTLLRPLEQRAAAGEEGEA